MKNSRTNSNENSRTNRLEPFRAEWQELLLIGGALRAGVFAGLSEGAQSAEELARLIGADTRAVRIVLEALVAGGYVEKTTKESYRLTGNARRLFVDSKSPLYSGHSIHHTMRLVERWLQIPTVIKTGTPDRRQRSGEDREHFIGSMELNAREVAPHVVTMCLQKLPGIESVIDIGGGAGTYSKAFLDQGLAVTLFDVPEVISLLKEKYTGFEGMTFIGGDFTVRLPSGPFDLAFLSNITHIYGLAANQALFERVAGILAPRKFLAVLDFVRGRSSYAPMFAVNMLVNTEAGGTWTEEEYTSWLGHAGFKKLGIFDIESRDQQLVLAQKI